MADASVTGSVHAPHLVVLVHGLWGNPSHMNTIAEKLREKHSTDDLRIFLASTNTGYNTYDGVETGGERVAAEIESELATVKAAGGNITRFSILGYSLGGLIARYCIGLLYARGLFDPGQLEPVNFTTFASPWLGARAPIKWVGTNVWNYLGARTLSTSGQQMFLTDKFRDTGRPLLAIMADPSSIFYRALAAFRKRILYSNIINDRSTPFYTTFVGGVDPFVDPSAINFSHIKGYEPTMVDISKPITRKPAKTDMYTRFISASNAYLTRIPFVLTLAALLPLTGTIYFSNAAYQTFRSSSRIQAHERGRTGYFLNYRVPLLIEQALENADARAAPQYLSNSDAAAAEATMSGEKPGDEDVDLDEAKSHASGLKTDAPTLALAPEVFEMIRNLNKLDLRKFPVHITLVQHAHAAILVRWKKEGFREGYTVIRHWVDEEFEI